ncbi:MAG: hypothetical protein ACI4K7_04215, partial [Oscillospiraceae bacterium]
HSPWRNYSYNGINGPAVREDGTGNGGFSVLGSIVFKSINSANDWGVAYLPYGGGNDKSSMIGTMITWDKQRWYNK